MSGIYGNIVLNEFGYYDQQVLQEMNFSKKDLQNPKTLEKINKKMTEPAVFKGLRYFINALLIIFNIAISIPTLGIGLLLTINKSIDISSSLKNYYPNKKDKTLLKFKEKVNELIKVSEEQLKVESDNTKKQELRETINNCKSVLKVISNKEKELLNIEFQSEIDEAEKSIKTLIQWFENRNHNGYDVYFQRNLFYLGLYSYKIPEKAFIDHIMKSYEKISIKSYSDDEDDLKYLSNYGNQIPELKGSEINKDNLINIAGHDDWQLYIGTKSKKIFECYMDNKIKVEVTNLTKVFNNSNFSDRAIIAADARLGYYKLSECPKQVEKKPFPIN